MTRDSLRGEHHIARHLNPKKIEESGLPPEHAFEPKAGSRMVSVNWLERFDGEPDQQAQLERVATKCWAAGVRSNPAIVLRS